ncbi:MAG: hypothetical protein JNL11_05935 [Bdellovibrionaceae bacterium]|nr:hypothetical protein [Pseudobdellovibrionaceae bacterium]
MKTCIVSIFVMLVTTTLSWASWAASTATPKTKTATSATKTKPVSNLSTDVKFGDQAVSGKYQLPMEALSVVENEKSIDDLIGVRKNFRDRVARTKGMR